MRRDGHHLSGHRPQSRRPAIGEREGFRTPSFFRYAIFALGMMLPAHLITMLALVLLDR